MRFSETPGPINTFLFFSLILSYIFMHRAVFLKRYWWNRKKIKATIKMKLYKNIIWISSIVLWYWISRKYWSANLYQMRINMSKKSFVLKFEFFLESPWSIDQGTSAHFWTDRSAFDQHKQKFEASFTLLIFKFKFPCISYRILIEFNIIAIYN